MTGTKLFAALVVAGCALALPGVSSAAQTPPPTQDSVLLTGGSAGVDTPSFLFVILDLDATSGPSGENPAGSVDFLLFSPPPCSPLFACRLGEVGGPVTCLAVNGDAATINFRAEGGGLAGAIITVQVVDGQPDTFNSEAANHAPADCSPLSSPGGPVSGGDIVVTDALPPPTSKDQCKHTGWRQFGFANEGQCVRSVT